MDFTLRNTIYTKELEKIEQSSLSILDTSRQIIILSRNTLNDFKKAIIKTDFVSVPKEVEFFKHQKQTSLIQLIYYTEIRSFELQFPKSNVQDQEKALKKKLRKLNRFYLYNIDFNQYVEAKLHHFDKQYYTRGHLDRFSISSSKFYFQDPDFSTPRDMLLGKIKAYKLFMNYLKLRLDKIKNRNSTNYVNNTNLKWTSSKSALTELIYALYYNRVINNGNVDIKEIAIALQKVLQFDLGDFYKIFSEIKSRKISRTKFLDDLSNGLLLQMDSAEE
ncbi:RteC domain-containing protein [uncultured Psychroserpens sp.]|uniref:RteC domain-containing protein n=1 Tax=uncultured Psychroserpens sp. TaxID=255436 RepID=UPI002622D176|nr:RteC domain-containing protein [uncultured Psychroserpens sp.]